jgi:hypothetical protein
MIGSQLASRLLYPRLGPRLLLTVAVAGSSVFITLLASMGAETSLWYAWLLLLGMGLSVGHVFLGTQAAAFATIPQTASGRASTIFNVGRRLGGALGVAAATMAMVLVGAGSSGAVDSGDASPYRVAFLVLAAINLLAIWPALAAHGPDAATTLPARGRAPAPAVETR